MALATAKIRESIGTHRSEIELMGTPRLGLQHDGHQPAPLLAMGRYPPELAVNQQVRQFMGDDLINEIGLIGQQQHRIQAYFPLLQPGGAGRGAALMIGEGGLREYTAEIFPCLAQIVAQALHNGLMEGDGNSGRFHSAKVNRGGRALQGNDKASLPPSRDIPLTPKRRVLASKHHKAFMADLKPFYRAVSEVAAEIALDGLEARRGQQYPMVIQSWRRKWDPLSAYIRSPTDVRKVIYITNAIASVHRQFRKLTKTKGACPNENRLLKALGGADECAGEMDKADPNWNLPLSPLAIYFDGRLNNVIML